MTGSRKRPKDPNQLAYQIVQQSTDDEQKPSVDAISRYLAEIGRRGGLKGGKARAKKLNKKKRSQIAKLAARARWKKSPS